MSDKCANVRCRSARSLWIRFRATGFWFRDRWFCGPSCLYPRFSTTLERLIGTWKDGKTVRHHSRLGSVLVDLGCLTATQLSQVLQRQNEAGGSLGHRAREMGFVSENELTEALSRQLKIPWIDDALPLFDPAVLGRVPKRLCLEFRMAPLTVRDPDETLVLGLGGPVDLWTIHMLRKMLACEVEPYFTCERTIDDLLSAFVAPFIDEASQEVEVFDPRAEPLTNLVLENDCALSGSRVRVHLFGSTLWVRFERSPRVQDIFLNLKSREESAPPRRQKLPIEKELQPGRRAIG